MAVLSRGDDSDDDDDDALLHANFVLLVEEPPLHAACTRAHTHKDSFVRRR
jgi:hypothetical protein